jgi:hypothetical protein
MKPTLQKSEEKNESNLLTSGSCRDAISKPQNKKVFLFFSIRK